MTRHGLMAFTLMGIGLALTATLFTTGQAIAASTTTDMNVTANITEPPPASVVSVTSEPVTTTVSVTPSGTSNYDFTAGTVRVNLPNGTPYKVVLGQGAHYDTLSRRLTDGTNFADYSLYHDTSRTTQWGDSDVTPGGTCPAGGSLPGTGNGVDQALTVFGRLSVPNISGTYTDTVLVTVHF